jgi:hypothetical protein
VIPRLLTIMGSGETSPTMVKVHRSLLAQLGPPPVPAVVLDTPFGFQENADEIVARAQAYFAESVGARVAAASLRSDAGADAHERAAFVDAVGAARYVFAGPGSPTYALRVWQGSTLPSLLADKLVSGGAITFASAAALTLGVATVPVYEIYKAGEPPRWLEGLDLLALAGLRAAVIPHYNNAEGGNHDTRYCYLGERRLGRMESMLPEGAFVLGVDEHTGLVLDLDAGTASVVGLGVVTVRSRGASAVFKSGTVMPVAELAGVAERLGTGVRAGSGSGSGPGSGSGSGSGPGSGPGPGPGSGPGPVGTVASPLLAGVRDRQVEFAAAIDGRDVETAVRTILCLDSELVAWSRDTLESDEVDRARDILHSMVLALGRLADVGARDPAEVLGPFVQLLLEQRAKARAARRFEDADELRDRLVELGVEVRDTPAGFEWLLADPEDVAGVA